MSKNAKNKYYIYLYGCDDTTVFPIKLTEEEVAVVRKLSEFSKVASTYGCMPTMDVEDEPDGWYKSSFDEAEIRIKQYERDKKKASKDESNSKN